MGTGRLLAGFAPAALRCSVGAVVSTRRQPAPLRARRRSSSRDSINPRYRVKNTTILVWLEITPKEELEMKTIIVGDEPRWRDRERKQPEMNCKE